MINPAARDPALLERLLLTSLSNATAAAALAAAHARGRGDGMLADKLAVDAMRGVLNEELLVPARVVIGEGERDKAPMLYEGEWLGPSAAHVGCEWLAELAVDPLEGTNLCARGEPGAVCVVAASLRNEGTLLNGFDGYMEKVVVGREFAEWIALYRQFAGQYYFYEEYATLLDVPPSKLAHWVSLATRKPIEDVVVMVLDRPRNREAIQELRRCNVQLRLIRDGDVTAALLALDPRHDVDIALGIGGSAEGVLAAAMTRVYGGAMEARWWIPGDMRYAANLARLERYGGSVHRIYDAPMLAKGHVVFSLTAVTPNDLLPGVRYERGGVAHTHTVSGRSRTGSINIRHTVHQRPPALPKELRSA